MKRRGWWYYLVTRDYPQMIKARVDSPEKLGVRFRAMVNDPPDLIMRRSHLELDIHTHFPISQLHELDAVEALKTGVPLEEWAK